MVVVMMQQWLVRLLITVHIVNGLEEGFDHYTNTWMVELHDTLEKSQVSLLAQELGLVNLGNVLPDSNIWEFKHSRIENKSQDGAPHITQLLSSHDKIKYVLQQVAKIRKKRVHNESETMATLVRRKRSHQPEANITLVDPEWHNTWHLNRGMGSSQYDMNVIPAWNKGYNGKNIVVTVVCDGLERDHPDIAANYDPEASIDINDHDDDPMPRYDYTNENRLGTRCAGEIAALANNTHCTVGAAFNAKIGGIRMLDGSVTDAVEAASFSHNINHIDIYAVQWGPQDNGRVVDGPGALMKHALRNSIKNGRNGKGSIIVWAAGIGGSHHDSCACDGYTNSIYTLSVNSVTERNTSPWYLEECASTIATTYSSGTSLTDRQISTTDLRKMCTSGGTGTGAAASIASGLIAIMLEANPSMTWRDVQYAIVATANPEPLTTAGGFVTNGAGRRFSHKFGFGLMDGGAMVDQALNWSTAPPQLIYHSAQQDPEIILHSSMPYNGTITVPSCRTGDTGCIRYVEQVQLQLNVSAQKRGAISVVLQSPSGTKSTLLDKRLGDYSAAGFSNWSFTSIHFWEEQAAGDWTFTIDTGMYSGELSSYMLILYGTSVNAYSQNYTSHNITCHETCDKLAGCFGSAPSQCIACNSTLVRIEDTLLCVTSCGRGYYRSGAFCKRCHPNCASCEGGRDTSCTSCDTGRYFTSYLGYWGTCTPLCQTGYFADSSNNTCIPCRSECHGCTSLLDCTICSAGYEVVNGQCAAICDSGKFRNSQGLCVTCPISNCDLCADDSRCSYCSSTYKLYNNRCIQICPKSTYQLNITSGSECHDCDPHCSTCYGPADNNCLTCRPGQQVSLSHHCIINKTCPVGQFRDLGVGDCEPCDPSCNSCSGRSDQDCASCQDNKFLLHGSCLPACGIGYYNYTSTQDSHSSCQLCDTSCVTCSGAAANQCTTCRGSAHLDAGSCKSFCPQGTYQKSFDSKNRTCANCSSECRTCSGPLSYDCDSCPDDEALTPHGYCVKDCLSGFYRESAKLGKIDHAVCKQCHLFCETCSGPETRDCASCESTYVLYNGQCLERPECYGQQYYDEIWKACKTCDSTCANCTGYSSVECTTCPHDRGLYSLDSSTGTGQCLEHCRHRLDKTACCAPENENYGLNCTRSNTLKSKDKQKKSGGGKTAGIAVGVTFLVLIPAVILAYIGCRYRQNGRCIWPNICKREGLSITADDVLSNNHTHCELDNTGINTNED